MTNKSNKFDKFIERVKNFDKQTYVVLSLEFIFGLILIFFDINFFINLAKGVSFLGEDYHAYEVGITVFLLFLCIMMIAIFIYDLFFHDYEKEKKDYRPKAVHNGRVIDITPEDESEKDEKSSSKK